MTTTLAERYKIEAGGETIGGMTFLDWYAALDKMIVRRFGIGVDDGVDFNSYDTWAAGGSVEEGFEVWAEAQPGLDMDDFD